MTLADFCEYCQSLPGVEGSTPFGPEVLVYKVGGKMFALAVPDELPHRVNLKCDPDTMRPQAGIGPDDASRAREVRQERDALGGEAGLSRRAGVAGCAAFRKVPTHAHDSHQPIAD
ncbi:MAG: MmcQ/YjbR family DNA-binding protein [Chthoniobacteraceae bacterium]